MNLTEKTVSAETRFSGRLLRLRVDQVTLPDGAAAIREVVEHPGGVCAVALTDEGELLLVHQYRYPFAEVTAEIPAGKLEPGEDPDRAVRRELAEETGYLAMNWRYLGKLYPTPGFCNEVDRIYLATGLIRLKDHPEALPEGEPMPHPDEDEFLRVERLPLGEAVERVMRGDLPDAKTQVALLMAQRLWERNEL